MTGIPGDKLSRISALRPPPGAEARKTDPPAGEERRMRLLRLLGAELRTTPRGCHLAVTSRFSSPAPCLPGPQARRLLAPPALAELADTSHWLFLDTETTGLSGGTGTYAFLVGLGWWEDGRFIVEQLFMRDHSEEASLLQDVARRLAERHVLVTFNGKSFDWPLLETRFRITRTGKLESPQAHLDLLHPSRQLWRFRLKSVALAELERQVLDLDRGPDIPSHTIPARYFDFLRGGAEGPIAEIFRHNQMDLRGLAALAGRIMNLLEEPEARAGDAGELFGVSRMLHRRGEVLLAAAGYQHALEFGLPQNAGRIAKRELALLARRQGDFSRAGALWGELLGDSSDGLLAYEQLAVHYEHRMRDPVRALALTREAMTRLQEGQHAGRLDGRQYRRWHDAFACRLARLEELASRKKS